MLKLYNYLTRKIEEFKPIKRGQVGFYSCGPTVYDFAHIGNLRTYVFEDVLERALIANGLEVTRVMNITDVDDKTIDRAHKEHTTLPKLTAKFTKLFLDDLKKLNVRKASVYPRATKHIKEMVSHIEELVKKGFAYEKAGSVYFSIEKFKDYGKLSQLERRTLKIGARVDADEYEKDNVQDFALWKAAKEGEPSWNSPWGKGRPGWHIECSVMSMKYLGKMFDIHTGGVDLIFPHHENEIAQSEAVTGKRFVNYWIEGEHLLVDGKKMAKSAGNFFTLPDIEAKPSTSSGQGGYEPIVFRYLSLTAHYRSKLNFTWESLESAKHALNNLRTTVRDWKKGGKIIAKYYNQFMDAVHDDINIPRVLAVLWELVNDTKHETGDKAATLLTFDEVLGLGLKSYVGKPLQIPLKIKKLVSEREQARKDKDWKSADNLRDKILVLGYELEDTATGPKLKQVKS